MKKIVINTCYGGFGLSDEAMERVLDLKQITYYKETDKNFVFFYTKAQNENNQMISEYEFERDDPALVQAVEELKEKANGPHADLKVVSIPDDVQWYVHEYDGAESIHEEHRIWD
jgi:hypothetical protein